MRLSTKGIYALEVAVDLSMNSDPGRPESVKNLAMRRGISEKYLERIIGLLRKAGIVTSIRGVYGGYFLARRPAEITAGEVLTAAEGSLAPVECLVDEGACQNDCEACVTKAVWEGMWQQIKDVVDNLTLQDLVDRCNEKV